MGCLLPVSYTHLDVYKRQGKPWELNRRINGLFIFPPQFDDEIGALEDIYQYHKTEDFFLRAKEDNIYIINPNIIGKYDLNTAFKYFKDSEPVSYTHLFD